jgi:hypothetical protein
MLSFRCDDGAHVMGRGRLTRWFGTGLALFALVLQLTLSFAHIHPDDLLRSAAGSDVVLDRGQPAVDHHDHLPGHAHDDCPICSVMHMAGTIVVPSPPTLVVPAVLATAPDPTEATPLVLVARRAPFQTRAPPQA